MSEEKFDPMDMSDSYCGLPGAVGESEALDYRSGEVPDGQKARIGWLRLYAYSRWKLDV